MTIDPGLFEENERMVTATGERQLASIGEMVLLRGGHLENVQIAYQTWGQLSPKRDNAILVCHAISGDSNAEAWWSRFVGTGKTLDTDRFYVICSNVLGGCQGSTGPSSLATDGKPYGSRFPFITIEDMVQAQARLVQRLGIDRLALVCGGSMGGMQALEWARTFPDRVERVWATASATRHSAMQIGFNEVARQAILRDPKWRGGDYDPQDPPREGLAIARMIGHLTYLSDAAFDAKFGRELQRDRVVLREHAAQFVNKAAFQIENYLSYQGEKFTERFDANSLLVVSNALDTYHCGHLPPSETRFLFTSFTSDWLYPSTQSQAAHEMALSSGHQSEWRDIASPLGHDAFLLDDNDQARAVQTFLSHPEPA